MNQQQQRQEQLANELGIDADTAALVDVIIGNSGTLVALPYIDENGDSKTIRTFAANSPLIPMTVGRALACMAKEKGLDPIGIVYSWSGGGGCWLMSVWTPDGAVALEVMRAYRKDAKENTTFFSCDVLPFVVEPRR